MQHQHRIRLRRKWPKKPFVRVTEIHKTKLGFNRPDTLTSMVNLASTYITWRWTNCSIITPKYTEDPFRVYYTYPRLKP